MSDRCRLTAEELHRVCDPASLGFATTEEIEPLTGALGQDDAMKALGFGMSLQAPGYNIFALGRAGSGRFTFVREALAERAAREPTPSDWCYVYNFREPRRPRALELPAGQAPALADAVRELIADLRKTIPQAMESDDVASRRSAIVEKHGRAAGKLMDELRQEFEEDPHVALIGTPDAMMVVGARGGEPLESDAYNVLPEEMRDEIDERVRAAGKRLFQVQRTVHQLQRRAREEVAGFHKGVTSQIVTHRIGIVKEKYADVESVQEYLGGMAEDIVKNAGEFMTTDGEEGATALLMAPVQEEFLHRYVVNPLITRDPEAGAPVVEESNPHLRNLLGRMEGQMRFGVMVTDFTRIAPGAAHRANGGYLLLKAEELLSKPMAWPALKRTLLTAQLQPADPSSELGLLATETLEPEPIPADLKVVLVGEPQLFYLLQQMDGEFLDLFKVKVDFAPHMDRTPESEKSYAAFVAAECERRALPAFDGPAVALIIEEGSRLADDQSKLTTRFREIIDLIREAAHQAGADDGVVVGLGHVERALADREHRNQRPRRQLMELLERGILAFEPEGEAVGQLYGIGLLMMSDEAFGRPIRVMASAFLGTRGVINIEREAALSGPIHNKGFLVLSGYLGWRFARSRPLILSANLSFDQLYEEVEGDSASAAELYALMSAISGVPIRQGIAVTGAVNQEGMILPVGGVTQKVEGFYAACEQAGLTGQQGVVLPRRNVANLVLRRPLREAVEQGRFHVWAIDRFDEGWPILTGREAGEMADDETFPEGSVHHEVARQLDEWAEKWKTFGQSGGEEGGGEE